MRIRNLKNAKEILSSSDYLLENPSDYKGKFNVLFGNDNPIHLEIGMGKGDYIIGMAREFPNINFIGLERYDSIVARALLKLENCNLPNLKIIKTDAMYLGDVFDKEISRILLNFSDPWPKDRHAKRRLTSSDFLRVYDKLFIGDCEIVQKTDNVLLFESSLVSLSEYGYILKEVSLDLENSGIFNIETEYERKFKNKGFTINYLRVEKKLSK